VAISPEEEENPDLVESIKDLLTKASAELYGATRQRAYFKDVTILVPQTWNLDEAEAAVDETFEDAEFRVAPSNPAYGHNPYTIQNRECGEPGDFTHLTSWFVLNHATNASDEFGRTDKVVVHEWAKLRWGVFEEYGYPGDPKFPMFYMKTTWGASGQVDVLKPNFCTSTEVEGEARDVVSGGECTMDPESGLPDSNCYFFPKTESTVASSYMALPFLDSVTDFCDETETNLHHAEIPTKHNLYCDGRSTWDVIKENEDFVDDVNPPNNDISSTKPSFRVVQSKDPKYVVLMDVSSSMQTGPGGIELNGVRSEKLRSAVKRWVTYEVADGTEVALVVFSNVEITYNPIIFPMAAVNNETRAEMIDAVDNMNFLGMTCIGCGIDRALNWDGALKGVNGGVIILITDGEQKCEKPAGCLTIEDMTPDVLERQTRVVTIAFGLDADPALEDLAVKSGGKSYFIDDYSGPGTINDAFTGSLTYQPGDVLGDSTTTVYQQDHQDVKTGDTLPGFFDIDVSIGREVLFQLEVQTKGENCTAPLTITLLRPDDAHTPEIENQEFTCTSSNFRMFRHTVADLALEGRWVYKVSAQEDLASVSIKVESKSRDPSTDPVMTHCWISTGAEDIDTTTDVKLAVVAEVSQGRKPVVGAKVEALVERPSNSNGDPQPPIQLQLLDNGGGADKIKNDGTYTRYFAKYTGKGRYSVKCQVSGDDETGVNDGFTSSRVFPKIPDPHSPLCCGSDAMPPGSKITATGNFTRQAAGGAFQVTNEVDMDADNIPPGRVTDLRANNLPDKIAVQFTAPGDDLDSNDKAASYVVKYSSTVGNLTGVNFDKDEFNTAVTNDDLVDSTLDPEVGGTEKTFFIKSSIFPVGEKFVVALKAVDEKDNQGKVSNTVQIYLPPAPTTPTTTVPTTTTTTTTTNATTTATTSEPTTAKPTTHETSTTPGTATTSERSTVHSMTGCKDQTCDSDGLFPGPELCSPDFCHCSWGVPEPKICEEGLVFNPRIGVCDWPWDNPDC